MPKFCVIKVQNLSKSTSKGDLKYSLRQYARSITSIRIVNCPDSPLNYAYVNCTDLAVAKSIVELIDKKMVLQSNRLTAILKWGGGGRTQKRSATGFSGRSYRHSSGTREMLESSGVGDTTATPTKLIYPLNPTRFSKESYFCDPLVVKDVVQGMQQDLARDEPRILVAAEKNAVSVSVDAEMAKEVSRLIKRSISSHEAKLKTVVDDMDYCCLPVLACHSVQERFAKSQAPFEVKVRGKGGYVSLNKLPQVYTGCGNKTVATPELARYLQPVANEKEYRWYWENEAGFHPYGTSASQSLEQVFQSKATFTLSIGPNSYRVDTDNMTQTNTTTNTVRQVERRPLPGMGSRSILIQIRAHSDYIKKARSEILKCIQENTAEVTVTIPPYGQDASSIDHLLRIAQRSFVFARKTDSGDIILRGRQDVVTDVELTLTKEILQMKPQQIEVEVTVTIPPYGQDASCIDRLLQIAQRSSVFAQKTNSDNIILRGRQDVVTDVELTLTKEILQMKPQQIEVEVTVTIPPYGQDASCIDRLLQIAQRSSVFAQKMNSDNIILRGRQDVVTDVELTLTKEILQMKPQQIEVEVTVTIPPYGQDASCIDRLLQIAQRSSIFAQKTNSDNIILRGRQDVVTDVELALTKEILQMKPQQIEVVVVQPSPDVVKTPCCWEEQHGRCELKLVGCGTDEWLNIWWRMAENGFWLFKVLCIERIQNLWLWDVYGQSRKRMSDKNSDEVNERELFHGTRNVPPVKIYNSEQGFDNRLSSRGMWGEGAYFAVRAAYSDRYAYTTPEGHKQMFLAKVITGITYKCPPDSSLKAPPKKSDHPSALHSSGSKFEDERYDSVSGNTDGSDIYVIYEHGKVYPAYLITYLL